MKVHLVTFAHGPEYIKSQMVLNKTYKSANIETHTMWRARAIMNTNFYKSNKVIFSHSTGFGLWIWKPYIILEKLKQIPDNEYVYYQDSSKYDYSGFTKSINPIIDFMEKNNIDLLPGFMVYGLNKDSIQPECLNYMGANNDYVLNHRLYQTSPLFIKKTEKTIQLIEEWLKYCTIPECIIRQSKKMHFYDQSILNVLLLKYNYKGVFCHNASKLQSKSYSFYVNLFYPDCSYKFELL